MGQAAHTVEYPDVTDFLNPYRKRVIPYISSVLSTIHNTNYSFNQVSAVGPLLHPLAQIPTLSTTGFILPCSNFLPPTPPLDPAILLYNRLGLSIYVRVSTQNAQFPKSPYKFASNEEFITYNNYKKIFC